MATAEAEHASAASAFVNGPAALTLAVLGALGATVASFYNIYGHLLHFRFPELQRPIIRVSALRRGAAAVVSPVALTFGNDSCAPREDV